jgi:hypothetical protein
VNRAFSSLTPLAQRRWSIASRTFAGVFGAYAVTSLFIVAGSLLASRLGVNRALAVLTTTQVSFLLYAVLIMAAFHTRTAVRAWAGLIILGAPLGLAAWALG